MVTDGMIYQPRESITTFRQKDLFSELRERCFTRLREKRRAEIKFRRSSLNATESKAKRAVDSDILEDTEYIRGCVEEELAKEYMIRDMGEGCMNQL